MRDDDSEQESFITALARGDELGAVIRAQIYIEHELIGFIRSRLAAPDSLTDADLSYARLVRLALALGLSSEFAKPFQAFARIRKRPRQWQTMPRRARHSCTIAGVTK